MSYYNQDAMAHYTALDNEGAQTILNLYQLPKLKGLHPMGHGISNSNYRVDFQRAHPPILLKISNDKDLQQLKQEHTIVESLHEWGFSKVILPLKNKEGQTTYHYGANHGALYPFVHGSVPAISENTCRQMGRVMAELHLSCQEKDLSSIRSYASIGQDLANIDEYLKSDQTLHDFEMSFKKIMGPYKNYLQLQNTLPGGIIHGDLYYDNTMFNGAQLISLLDFEQAGVGSFLMDIGIAISGSCLDEDGNLEPLLIEAFLQEYVNLRPLNGSEKKNLKSFILLGLFSVALWRIYRFNHRQLDPSKQDNYKELLTRAHHFFKQPWNYE